MKSNASNFSALLLSSFLAVSLTLTATVVQPSFAASPKPATKSAPAVKPTTKSKVQPNSKSAASATKPGAKTEKAEALPPDSAFSQVIPAELLKTPTQYQDKYVEFVGVFNRFSDTGLDYKKAFRDSRDYVSLFILRPDVEPHTIPLSELKLFFPRKKSEEVLNLESGDTIRIKGKVFSTALNEPWVDIMDVKIIQKTKDSTKKPTEEQF